MINDVALPSASEPVREPRGERPPGAGPSRTEGTHGGHLDAEARRRRAVKNARTVSHRGQAEHKPCSSYSACNHARHGRKP